MMRTIAGIAIVSTLVFTATAWSQESPMDRGKMGMGESPQMKACMQMMGEMETTNAVLDELVGRMQTADGGGKMAVMEEVLTALVAQQREMHKRMRSMPQMMCGGMMRMMMQ